MSTFNITRFSQALKCQYMNSRKDWMLVFGIYTIALSFLNILFVRSTTFDEGDYHDVVAKHGVAYMEDAYPILIKGIAVFDIIFRHAVLCQFPFLSSEKEAMVFCLFDVARIQS